MYPFDVALIQSNCHVVRRLDERDERIERNLKRIVFAAHAKPATDKRRISV